MHLIQKKPLPMSVGLIRMKMQEMFFFFSHVPHGFYEKQMRDFFSQFGIITNLRYLSTYFLVVHLLLSLGLFADPDYFDDSDCFVVLIFISYLRQRERKQRLFLQWQCKNNKMEPVFCIKYWNIFRLGRSRKTGRSRGFAFVEFKYEEVAKVFEHSYCTGTGSYCLYKLRGMYA